MHLPGCRATPAAVVLSRYPSPLYEELCGDWHRVERRVLVSTSNHYGGATRWSSEALWLNWPLTEQPPSWARGVEDRSVRRAECEVATDAVWALMEARPVRKHQDTILAAAHAGVTVHDLAERSGGRRIRTWPTLHRIAE